MKNAVVAPVRIGLADKLIREALLEDTSRIIGPEPDRPNAVDLAEARHLVAVERFHLLVPRHAVALDRAVEFAAWEAALFYNLAVGTLAALRELGLDIPDLDRKDT